MTDLYGQFVLLELAGGDMQLCRWALGGVAVMGASGGA